MSARDRVLAELAALGPRAADAFRPGAADPVTLLSDVRELAVFADQIQGELARLAGVLDVVEGAGEAGYKSVAAFLRHTCGRSPGRAGELVAAGRALRRLEATGQALMAGEISFDAAHVICRALAQISDEAMARTAEEQMLAYARTRVPASPGPGPDPGRGESDGGVPGEPEQPGPGEARPDGECAPNGEAGPDGEAGADGERCSGDGPADAAGSSSGAGSGAARSWPAPGLDPTQLRILGEDLIYRADPDAVEERVRKRFERRHLSFGFTMENTGTISGACGDTLSLEIIKTAVHAFGPPLGSEDSRTAAQRRMDGLTAACQAALDSGAAGTRHGAAPHLSVLVEEQTLADAEDRCATSRTGTAGAPDGCCARTGTGTTGAPDGCYARTGTGTAGAPDGPTVRRTPVPLGPPPARTGFGATLTARQVLALACHAELSIIRWSDGIPLDVGRRYRTETPAIRRALETRDQGCRAPGCGMPAAWCTGHHLKPWSQGGQTSLQDTALFCFVHHNYFIHLLGWTVTGNPNGTLHFTHPQGWPTLDSPPPGATKPRPP